MNGAIKTSPAAGVKRKFAAGKGKGRHDETARALEKTRRCAAVLNRYLDLIPARFYLGTENAQVAEAKKNLDPKLAKTTSQLVEEAAFAATAADASTAAKTAEPQGAKGAAAAMTKAAKRRLQRAGGASAVAARQATASADPGSQAGSRKELQEKLEQRIAALKEERRLKQSEADKAKKAAAGGAAPQAASGKAAATGVGKSQAAAAAEIGRVSFAPSSAALPFQAIVGKKGDKVKRLKAELRRNEHEQNKIAKAEARGEGDKVRRDLAMDKALKRARGEKVHDNTAKLRKAQKAMEMKKVKGKSKWEAMKDHQKQLADDKQARRKENLKAPRGKKKKAKAALLAEKNGEEA